MTGDNLTVTQETPSGRQRPKFLDTTPTEGLAAPSINVIPNTPTPTVHEKHPKETTTTEPSGGESPTTSGADEGSGAEDEGPDGDRQHHHSSPYSSGSESGPDTPTQGESESSISALLLSYKNSDFLEKSPEQFAQLHNMILPDGIQNDETATGNCNAVVENDTNLSSNKQNKGPCLFSVDLGKKFFFAECLLISQKTDFGLKRK